MATALKYLDTAKTAQARITTGITATDGTGALSTFTWGNVAPTGDWMPVKLIVSASSATGVGNPADSLFHIFLSDGTVIRKIRTVDLGDPTVGTVTAGEFLAEINFGPEWIFPTTCSLQVSCSVTPTAGNLDVVLIAQAA